MIQTVHNDSIESLKSDITDLSSTVHLPRNNNANIKDKKLYIFIVSSYVTIILSTIGLTQWFPVISSIAKSKGLSNTETGLLYCSQSILCSILFPISSVILTRVDKKLSLCLCSFLIYCSFILYGFVANMSRVPFYILALILTNIQGFCETMIFLSANLIMWETFPDKHSSVIALQELATSIGYVSGPSICAILYPWLGFLFMYVLVGILGLLVTLVILATLIFSNSTETSYIQERGDPWLILRIMLSPTLCLHLLVIFLTAFFFNYFYPVIGPYLISRYHVTVSTVGWVIMSGELAYMVCSLTMGFLYDRYIKSLYIVVGAFGLFLQALAIFFYPPSFLISQRNGNYIPVSVLGSILNGLGIAFCYIPILSSLLIKAEKKFEGVSNVEPSVAGLFTGAYYFGEGAGMFISGVLADYYSLDVISTYLSGFMLVVAATLFIIGLIKFRELKMIKFPFSNSK